MSCAGITFRASIGIAPRKAQRQLGQNWGGTDQSFVSTAPKPCFKSDAKEQLVKPSSFNLIRRLTVMSGQPQKGFAEATNSAIPGLRRTAWDQQDLQVEYPKLDQDKTADVVIVGAGIAGLSVAYNLVRAGKKVIVLEARCRGAGQTGRTTAHLMPWYDDFYFEVERIHGIERARQVADSYMKCIDWVEQVVKDEGIDCHFARVDGHLFPHEEADEAYEKLKKEFEACKRLGVPVEMVDLKKDPAHGQIGIAIRFPGAGEFHPLMYLNGLAKAITKHGGQIFEQSAAFKIEGENVTTTDGHTVSAQALVLATNSPLNHNLLIHARQAADHSYVIGIKIPKGSVPKAEWWDTNDTYHYVRIEEKDGYDVLIVGGEDTSTGMKPTDYHDPYANLEKWAKSRWTAAADGEVVYKWTGQVFEPADLLHLIGLEPLEKGSSNQYIVTGDSGQGITGSSIAGILITDLILDKPNPWAEAYSPSRLLPIKTTTLQNVAEEATHTMQGFKDFIPMVGTDAVDIEDLKPYSGCVIQKGTGKMAVYRDGEGNIHQYSAVCPHMKCIVKWNPIDATFDCPCHGSIFDHTGRCINGPAKANLSPL
ncbi:hypothetical protein M758_6G034900 [Ceratodon purpureus]|nr:hypothetical protein M758_6G034900 [Ceratodon purpureus]